ncbi:stellacyanin-like [Juglans microcarpa x Juglans regia]|uniref:stellacyanin-like n=1 Tax=Juglans microcarpa x Juglans regia TaxID=2249226 RepID=UPI001B7D987C|nr:stellacyanin-like [Juglans microcarpa x Juglans regia]
MAMPIITLLILVLATPAVVYGAQHVVGGSAGWSQTADYSTWAAGETFLVGDTLVFNYDSTHKVDEVSQSDYTSCNSGNAIASHQGGSTTINLSSPGSKYFICPSSGHCSMGMKLAVNVVATSTTPSPPSGSTTPSDSTPPSTTVSPPPPPPSGATIISYTMNNVMFVSLLVSATIFAFMG